MMKGFFFESQLFANGVFSGGWCVYGIVLPCFTHININQIPEYPPVGQMGLLDNAPAFGCV